MEVLEQHLHQYQGVEYLLLHRKDGEAEAAWNWQEYIHLSSIDEEGSNLEEAVAVAVAVASKAEAEKSNNSKEVVDSVHGNYYVFFYLCFCYYCYYYSMNHPSHTHSLN